MRKDRVSQADALVFGREMYLLGTAQGLKIASDICRKEGQAYVGALIRQERKARIKLARGGV